MVKYQGVARDRMNELPDRKTKLYDTYQEAHEKAEALCKKHFTGDRGEVEFNLFRTVQQLSIAQQALKKLGHYKGSNEWDEVISHFDIDHEASDIAIFTDGSQLLWDDVIKKWVAR